MQVSKMFMYKLYGFFFSLAFHGHMCSLQVLVFGHMQVHVVVLSTEITRCEFPITFINSWIYPADLVFFGGGQSHCDAVRSAFHVDVALAIYLK